MGIDLVIDTNCLRAERLRDFLAEKASNRAVLAHEVAVESFRGGVPDGIIQSWTVLRAFPRQILMLKAPRDIARIDCAAPGIVHAMVNKRETRAMARFPAILDAAEAGNTAVISQLKQRYVWSRQHTEQLISDAVSVADQIAEIERSFSAGEIAAIRKGDTLKLDTLETIFRIVDSVAALAIIEGPIKILAPARHHRVNHFIWRRSLVHVVYLLHLIERGATRRADAKVRNDAIDSLLATYATYFAGIMTNDQLPNAIHDECRAILISLGGRVP